MTPSRSYAGLRTFRARDLFAGIGWDIAARELGWDVDGWDNDPHVQHIRTINGLKNAGTGDVRDCEPVQGEYLLDIASPPCQTFAAGGKGVGRAALDAVLKVVRSYATPYPIGFEGAMALTGDPRTALVVEPLRVALEGLSPLLAWEQVPAVLPVWEACAEILRPRGWDVVTGILDAADYGVPQVRKRAVLIARADGVPAALPEPTHPVQATMADGLGWGMTARPYPTIASSRTTGGPDKEKVGGSGARRSVYAEQAAGRWISHGNPYIDSPGSVRLPMADVRKLQTVPDDFELTGTDRAVFRILGNLVPPVLARAILAPLTPGATP